MAQENNMMHKIPSNMEGTMAFTDESLPSTLSQNLQTLPQKRQEFMSYCTLCSFRSLSQSEVLAHLKYDHMVDEEEKKFVSYLDDNDNYNMDLENHSKAKHQGMFPVSVSSAISKSTTNTKVRRTDAMLYAETLSAGNADSSNTSLSYTTCMEQADLGSRTINNSVSVSQSMKGMTSLYTDTLTRSLTDAVSSFTENDTLTRSMTDPVYSFTENDSLTRSMTDPVSSFTENDSLTRSMTDPVSSFTENDSLTRSMTDPVSSFTENDSLSRSTLTGPVSLFTENESSYHHDIHISFSDGGKESGKVVEMKEPLHSIFPANTEREMIIVESAADNFVSGNPKLENDIAGKPLYTMSSDFSEKTEEDHIKIEELNVIEMDEQDQITPPLPHEVQKNGINKTSGKSKLKGSREAMMETLDTTSNKSRISEIKSMSVEAKSIHKQGMRRSVINQQSVRHQRSLRHQHQRSMRHQLPMYNLYNEGEKKLENLMHVSDAYMMRRNSVRRQKRATCKHVQDSELHNIAQKDSGFNTPCWKCFKKSVFCIDSTSVCQKAVKLKKRICENKMNELTKGVIVIVDRKDGKTETSEKKLIKQSRRNNQEFDSNDIGGISRQCVYQMQTDEEDEIDCHSEYQMDCSRSTKSKSFHDYKSPNKEPYNSNIKGPRTYLRKSASNLDMMGSNIIHVKSVHDMKEVGTRRKRNPQRANEITMIVHNTNKSATISSENQTLMQSNSKKNIRHHSEINADYQINTDVNSENIDNKERRKNGNKSNKNSSVFDIKQKGSFQCWLCFHKFEHCLELKNHILDEHASALWAIFEDFNAQPPLIFFCPNNCMYSTFKSEELTRHIASCQKLDLHNEEKPLFDVYNFISQEYVKLQQKISSSAIVDQRRRHKASSQNRKSKIEIQQDFSITSLIEDEENDSNEILLERNTEDLTLPSHQNIQTKGQEASVTERHLKALHKCHRCSLAFSSTLLLEKHLQRQHNVERQIIQKVEDNTDKICFDEDVTDTPRRDLFRCDECEKVFTDSSQFCDHISKKSGKKTFKCKKCDKTFDVISNYNNHMKIHKRHKLKTYKCNRCSKSFNYKSHLRVHTRMHTGEKQCLIDKKSLVTHMRTHTGEKKFKCNQCGKGFVTRQCLQQHMRTHTGEKPFKCNQCQKGFVTRPCLNRHMKTHTGEKPFKCSQCGKNFVSKTTLTIHMMLHTGEKPFKCNECDQTFRCKFQLQTHNIRAHSSEMPLRCNQCRKGFIKRHNLQVHMRTHTGEKPFKCNECGQTFRCKFQLQTHNIRAHSSEMPFRCNLCGKGFVKRRSLQEHMRTHTGEKPFKCNECGQTFRYKFQLQTHNIRAHSSEMPLRCNQCGKGFVKRQNLQVHMRTHTGEKPFKCNECGQTFRVKAQLQRHNMRTHTGEKPFKCK